MKYYCITTIHITLLSPKLLSYFFSTVVPLLLYHVKVYRK